MTVTCADLIDETRRYLLSSQRETLNSLSASISTTSATTCTLTYDLGGAVAGSIIAVDLELMYVWAADTTTKTLTVQRGYLGSTAATHSSGAIVYVNSKFPAFSIFQALNADLDDLSQNGVYQIVNKEITFNAAVMGYDLGVTATDIIDVLAVRANIPGPSQDWVPINRWRLDQAANTTDFTTGFSLTLLEEAYPGLAVRVTYAAPFTKFTATTDAVTTTGLPTTAYDLPPLGAAMRLSGVREVQRNFNESQGDTRRASEVPPNAQLAGYQALARERARRLKSEASRLASNWPVRRKGLS